MARPISNGSLYFPLHTDIFSDNKIKSLRANYGTDGFTFYIYLLCQIYREHFYIKVSDELIDIFSFDLNMNVEKISQMINFLLKRSLFNDKLFKSDKVLTSAGIQKRYCEMVKKKGEYRAISVDKKLWLLSKEDTPEFIKFTHFDDFGNKNDGFREEKGSFGEENPDKINKSKINKNNSVFKPPTLEEVKAYCKEKGFKSDPEDFFDYYASVGWKVGNKSMKDWQRTMNRWERNQYKYGKEEERVESIYERLN